MEYNKAVKASSLFHAIMVCVVISIFCMGFVLFASYSRIIEDFYMDRSELIKTNQSITNYVLSDFSAIEPSGKFQITSNGIISQATWKDWGCYKILNVISFQKNDTLSRSVMIGSKEIFRDNLTLYIPDYDKPLKFSGNVRINGNMYIPGGRMDYAYLNGVKGNSIETKGNRLDSENILPEVNFPKSISTILNYKAINLGDLNRKNIYQPFDKETLILKIDKGTILRNLNLKGNIVIHCDGDLAIGSSVKLEDVIVKATSVRILSGFKGNLQIIVQKEVILDQDVSLRYPSGIYAENKTDSTTVTIGSNSKVAGTIILGGNSQITDNIVFTMEDHSEVLGDIYCNGISILSGKIIGRIFSNRVGIIGETGISDNVLMNTELDVLRLPEYFVSGLFFKSNSIKKKQEIVKIL